MPKNQLRPLFVTTLVAIAALCSAPVVSAKEHKAKTKTHKVVKSPAVQDSGSGESRHDRDRRLLRECKGRVNAGACAGYTG